MYDPPPPPVEAVRGLCREGRVLDAWKLAQTCPLALHQWPAGEALQVAAGLAGALGAARLRSVLEWRNWRHQRRDPRWFFQALFSRLRFVPAVNLIREIENLLPEVPAGERGAGADLLAILAWLHARHRDFRPAFERIAQALEQHPESAWIHVQHSMVLELADRYDDALAAARTALALRPCYHVAVGQGADILAHLGRDDEAINLLSAGDRLTQHAGFAIRLQAFHSEREDHRAALACIDRIEERSPLIDKPLRRWLDGRRADFHFMAGDIEACLGCCGSEDKGFHGKLAARLRAPEASRQARVRLKVPFVRQYRTTCAPATLAALAAFWGQPHDHLAIAAAICHEGTPWHKERRWAEDHGFAVREFRLSEESLHAVIDRGLPFTLTTSWVTSGHLQACIGYDARSGVILLRDPTERHYGEMFVDNLLQNHPLDGPRAMLMVPADQAELMAGLVLPDEAAYDSYHRLRVALDGHQRTAILAAAAELSELAPEGLLARVGEADVAAWKRDWVAHLAALEQMLERAPDHQQTQLRKAGALRALGRWRELRDWLEAIVARPDADPVFFSELGELLMEDARYLPRAERYLLRALRCRGTESRVFESLARLRAKQHRHQEAGRLRRIASCLAPDHEPYARACFDEYRALDRTPDGLAFLGERVAVHGPKAAGPWLTLAQAQQEVRSDHAAAATLRQALDARPADGELQLRAGAMMAAWGGDQRRIGLDWMAAARGRVADALWLRESAAIAGFLGDREIAIRHWRELLEWQPRDDPAYRNLARLLAEQDGADAPIALLDEATARFPDALPLWALKAEWLVDTRRGPLASLDRALELDPTDTWLLRERALRRHDAGDVAGSEADAREAVTINPWAAPSHGILAHLLAENGRRREALESLRQALRLDVDYSYAARLLVQHSQEAGEEARALGFIGGRMREQASGGEAIATYQQLGWPLIAPPPLLRELQDYCGEHPDLWQAWSARIEQALRMRMDGEALQAATTLTGSFPLLPRAWLELARVHRTAGRYHDELAATARAADLSPGWDEAARAHAAVLELLGRAAEAAVVLRRACQLDPLNGANYGHLADLLRRTRDHGAALDVLLEASVPCPYYEWGWDTAAEWARKDQRIAEFRAALERASERNGHNHAWWRTEATAWDAAGDRDGALAAIRRGLELAPANVALREGHAYQLWAARRFDDALAACAALPGEAESPMILRGRRAWLLMHSGQPLAGVAELRAVVARHPDYGWALAELAGWHDQRGEWAQLRELCLKGRRARPNELRVLGFLGKAERNLGNTDAAIQVFARAHALDPDYTFAARELLDLQFQAGRLDDAAATLARLEYYADSAHVAADRVELELKCGATGTALACVDALCERTDADEEVFRRIAKLFGDHGRASEWRQALRDKLEQGPCAASGALPALLAGLSEKQLKRDATMWIYREPEGSPARVASWRFMFRKMRQNPQAHGRTLRGFASKRVREFHQHSELWNELGQALVQISAAREAVTWFADWRERPAGEVNAATLLNLAAALDSVPGDDDTQWQAAAAIRAEAYRRFPDDSAAMAIRAGHALHLAVDGRYDDARAVLADYDANATWDYYQAIGAAARAVLHAADGDAVGSRQCLTAATSHLGGFGDLGTVRLRGRALAAVARLVPEARGTERRLRKLWKLWTPAQQQPAPLRDWSAVARQAVGVVLGIVLLKK